MYGYNYEVFFGIDIFDSNNLNDIYQKIKLKYSHHEPSEVHLIRNTENEFWNKINYGLMYRGGDVAGLTLSSVQESELNIEQEMYKSFLRNFLAETVKIYSFPNKAYMPFMHLFWGFSFILVNDDLPSVFIYGGSID